MSNVSMISYNRPFIRWPSSNTDEKTFIYLTPTVKCTCTWTTNSFDGESR
jgi:hypothetical protein